MTFFGECNQAIAKLTSNKYNYIVNGIKCSPNFIIFIINSLKDMLVPTGLDVVLCLTLSDKSEGTTGVAHRQFCVVLLLPGSDSITHEYFCILNKNCQHLQYICAGRCRPKNLPPQTAENFVGN